MAHTIVQVQIPFESLVESVSQLGLEEKRQLESVLEQQIGQAEEDLWDQDPIVQAEIREARADYAAGNYVTLDDYLQPPHKAA
jgi:hypothetical protein